MLRIALAAGLSLARLAAAAEDDAAPPGGGRPERYGYVRVEEFVTGMRYHVDSRRGSDAGDGSAARPWKSLERARKAAKPGDGVYLADGDYGVFSEKSADRDGFVVFMNEKGASPSFSGIALDYRGRPGRAFLAFAGIRIAPQAVRQKPGTDPQDPKATQSSYVKTANPVAIRGASDVLLFACEIAGQSKYLTELAVSIGDSSRVTVSQADIHDVHRAVSYDGSTFLSFIGNHIHRIAGSAFKGSDGTSTDILIEGNHAHDSNYDYADDYCPRAPGANYHGSAVAIRGDRMTIRNNVFHDGFNSAGIMTYDADSASADLDYSDILIENNLLYDIRNDYALRFYLIGKGVMVRNNLIVGHRRSSGAKYYDTAVVLHSLAKGSSGAALAFHNNVVVGMTNFGVWWGEVRQSRNIFYSCMDKKGNAVPRAAVGGGSFVATDSATSAFFEKGFFRSELRFDWDASVKTNPKGHGKGLSFEYADGSLALGFGDPSLQPPDGLGGIDSRGFLTLNPVKRSGSRHSAGPWP